MELINEITGSEKGNRADDAAASTFLTLKELADFEGSDVTTGSTENDVSNQSPLRIQNDRGENPTDELTTGSATPLTLSYTISLNLPETDDINVFNAIFKSLNENILKNPNG